MKKRIRILVTRLKSLPHRGTTLVELLLYLGLVTILLGVLTQIFVSILDIQLSSEATSSVETDSRFILSRLTHDIQRSDSISIPGALGTQSDNLQMTINGISYSYSVINDDLVLTRATDTYQVNGYDTTVSDVTFTRIGNSDGNETIQVVFKATSKTLVNGEHEAKTLQTTISTR